MFIKTVFKTTSGPAEDHMILMPLEQLHTSRDSIRKAREAFLIHRGKTLGPTLLLLLLLQALTEEMKCN